jgi:hypothetical protein
VFKGDAYQGESDITTSRKAQKYQARSQSGAPTPKTTTVFVVDFACFL